MNSRQSAIKTAKVKVQRPLTFDGRALRAPDSLMQAIDS